MTRSLVAYNCKETTRRHVEIHVETDVSKDTKIRHKRTKTALFHKWPVGPDLP